MRSWLYTPANNPRMIIQAGIYGADGIVFDLEDSVTPDHKNEARILLGEALKELKYGRKTAVRINGIDTPWWKKDLAAVVSAGVRIIRLPKVERGKDVEMVSRELDGLEESYALAAGVVRIQCILETPEGIEEVFNIGRASSRVEALSFGAEDYCASLGILRRGPAFVLDYPRSRIVNAAAALGLEAVDTVWSDFRDVKGLEADAVRARQLGFSGKSVIHPDQIKIVNEIFAVTPEEAAWAEGVLAGTENITSGVLSIDGCMVDLPVIKQAKRVLEKQDKQS